MKIKILFFSVLAVSLLMMVPSISAVEYDATVKANENSLVELLKESDVSPQKAGLIRWIFHLIMKLIIKVILLPLKIVKMFLRILWKLFRLPFKIFWWIIDIITPFKLQIAK